MGKTQHMLWRICLVALLALVLTVTMAVRLLRLQLAVPTEKAAENSPKTVGKTTVYTQSVEAMRGEILDRYGRPLVTNVVRYDLRFVYALWNRKTPNETILTLFALCDRYGLTYQDALPISLTEECYLTDRTGAEVIDRRLTNFLEARGWDTTIEADELMHRLRQHYGVDASLSYEDARRLIGLRYDLDCANFSSANPFAFLKGIPMELVLHVNEQQDLLPGVCVVTSYDRVYETEYAAHLLGYMGGIYREEYEALKAEGYALDDRVGKDGAEKAFESYLRGIDGYQKMRLDSDGRVVEVIEEQPAQAGNNVMLTLDIRLQAVVERALADQIELMVAEGIEDPTKAQDVAGGAAVVVDIATGDILASASYPTFDVSQFYALYSDLAEDPLKPMLNRAVGGIYSPGSIFKMVTSVAGLEQGIITPETIITDTGVYRFYKDYQPTCWIYTSSYGLTHGDETVVGALRDSCNIFFFDVGRQLGIEQLSTYARAFGFGEYTGIELNGESRGYVASPEAKKKLEGKSWVDGDTLAAAIGQSSNLFTPLQMANYIATLANGGTRYETHLLKYVCASDYSSVVTANQSVIAGRVEMSDLTYRTVMEGMSEVTENGTAAGAFKNYDIHVGGKTGSAQVATGTANSVFAAFAPFEDPKIAVVVVVEHGGSGNRIAPIARNIFDAYFALNDTFGQ